MACGKNPFARSEPLAPRAARRRGRVLFGYFLLHEQEKVTRPPGRRTKHTGTSVGFREAPSTEEQRAKAKWIPAFAGTMEESWIPACAGTTKSTLGSRSGETI